MCGSPAVPNTSAMPSEIWSHGFLNSSPGVRKFRVTTSPLAPVGPVAAIRKTETSLVGLVPARYSCQLKQPS
jgi:hypothetical protein